MSKRQGCNDRAKAAVVGKRTQKRPELEQRGQKREGGGTVSARPTPGNTSVPGSPPLL